jgi:hypothetical protein
MQLFARDIFALFPDFIFSTNFLLGILRSGKKFRNKKRICGAEKMFLAASVSELKNLLEKSTPADVLRKHCARNHLCLIQIQI